MRIGFIAHCDGGSFFYGVTLELHDLEILFRMKSYRQADLEWFGQNLRIGDGCLICNRIRAGSRESLNYMQIAAVEIPGCVEPSLVVEVRHVHHQSVALPMPPRIAQPVLQAVQMLALHLDVANGVDILRQEGDDWLIRRLHDLKRIRNVG